MKLDARTATGAAGSPTASSAAPHARTYVCELLSHERVVGRASCTSTRGYTRLRAGTCCFVVGGVNRAGIARKATVYGFKVG